MMYSKKIRMQNGCRNSNNTQEIAEIYVDGCDNPGFFPKATLHDYLKTNPNSIRVNISPYPYVVPATSFLGEKFPDRRRTGKYLSERIQRQGCHTW